MSIGINGTIPIRSDHSINHLACFFAWMMTEFELQQHNSNCFNCEFIRQSWILISSYMVAGMLC